MEPRKGPIKVPVRDKRRQREAAAGSDVPSGSPLRSGAEETDTTGSSSASRSRESSDSSPSQQDVDYHDLYMRAVADLENERKRFKTREGERAERSVRALVEGLLPVLDNFERAIAHGEGGEGVALVFKQLAAVLETEGLVEIPAEGAEFDPNVHDAVESREQPGLEIPAVIEVHRRGYLFNGQLLRAALVVVGRPEEPEDKQE